jgi:hypothetical protein
VIPEKIELPFIRFTEEIERLTVAEVKLYLEVYDIEYHNRWPQEKLKDLLRVKLGFTNPRDLAVNYELRFDIYFFCFKINKWLENISKKYKLLVAKKQENKKENS